MTNINVSVVPAKKPLLLADLDPGQMFFYGGEAWIILDFGGNAEVIPDGADSQETVACVAVATGVLMLLEPTTSDFTSLVEVRIEAQSR